LGRNLDWPSIARLHQYTLVIVYRPDGKRAFASITFPGVLGCTSGMNDAGLVIAMLDAFESRDGAARLNPLGIPTLLMLRRILEECTSVEEAVTLLRSIERASSLNIAVCDQRRGAVLEVTTKNVVVRPSESGVCLCTNHFRSAELATSKECWRYDRLLGSLRSKSYSVSDIGQRLHEVNQGHLTLQTMVFEPRALDLHLAFGEGPATRLPMSRVNLAELFQPNRSP
jgi:predicted choloylglycine hydrolase